MKKTLTIIASLFSLFAAAQNTGSINGQIVDGNAKTIASATIALAHVKDTIPVKFTVADGEGHYHFDDMPAGKYIVVISAVGHQKGFSPAFDIDEAHKTVQLKTIELIPVAKAMGGITVTAKKPLIEQKIDRTVVNVEASVTNVGSSALEVLEKSPGITVDKDGNISLKGKEGVLVLVDGRPTQLSGTDLANMLRNMQAAQLDQIEIMTNPPAKFDAAGNAGVINIKTKKNKQAGYNGSINLGYGQARYPKFNESVNLNYKENKVNVFTSLGHNYRKSYNDLFIKRNITNRSTKELENYFDQTANMLNEFNGYNAKLGMDYYATKKTTYGIVLSGATNPGTFGNRNLTLISDPYKNLLSRTTATADYDQAWKNFSTNLNFRTVLDTLGKELTADVDYISYDTKNDQVLINSYFNATGAPLQKADTLLGALPQNIHIYSAKTDYLQPLKKGARFEAGLKTSFVKTDNNARYDSLQYGQTVHDFNRSNYFIYEENINAAYANLSGNLGKKISAQLGLRLENTHAKGNQVTSGQKFDRQYTQLFPTAYFQYKINDKNNLGLNYGRRIRRPNYESLNPFIKFLDRYTYMQGNPDLKPQFSDNIEMSHTYKNFFTTTINYSLTHDIIQGIIEQKGQEAYARQSNIAKQRQYGIAINANMPVTKWWTNSIYVNVYNNKFTGIADSTMITVDATALTLNGTQQFKFAKTWTAEVGGFFRSGGIDGVIKTSSMGMVNIGLSKQILKNNGTLKLGLRDVFKTQQSHGISKYGNVDANFTERRESRVMNIGFSYRFSKGKMGNLRKRQTGSANEEQNRAGGGN